MAQSSRTHAFPLSVIRVREAASPSLPSVFTISYPHTEAEQWGLFPWLTLPCFTHIHAKSMGRLPFTQCWEWGQVSLEDWNMQLTRDRIRSELRCSRHLSRCLWLVKLLTKDLGPKATKMPILDVNSTGIPPATQTPDIRKCHLITNSLFALRKRFGNGEWPCFSTSEVVSVHGPLFAEW